MATNPRLPPVSPTRLAAAGGCSLHPAMDAGERPVRRSGVQMLGRRPTMVDVAREAGVGLKTVSRVGNDEPGGGAPTPERFNRAIARLRYRRNDFARRLRSHSPTATIGLVVEDVTSPRSAAI